jgi:hypothetical protein
VAAADVEALANTTDINFITNKIKDYSNNEDLIYSRWSQEDLVTVCRNTLIDFGVGSSDAEWCGKVLGRFGKSPGTIAHSCASFPLSSASSAKFRNHALTRCQSQDFGVGSTNAE